MDVQTPDSTKTHAEPESATTVTAPTPHAAVSPIRTVLLILLLAVGGIIWWRWTDFSGLGRQTRPRTLWLFLTLILAATPPTRRGIARLLDRLRHPTPRTQRVVMLGL